MSTKLKTRKNKYGFDVVDCPFCGAEEYARNDFRGLKSHITTMAKREALAVALDGLDTSPHLVYYKAHTVNHKVVVTPSRRFDDDLQIVS